MKKILFLDIDGVLNTNETEELKIHHTGEEMRLIRGVERSKVRLLREIIDRVKCEVVLSSAWRCDVHWEETMRLNVPGVVFSGRTGNIGERGKEIEEYVGNRKVVFVVLDDERVELGKDIGALVKVRNGLTDEVVEEVIREFRRLIRIQEHKPSKTKKGRRLLMEEGRKTYKGRNTSNGGGVTRFYT